ncbi:MAG: HlyD family efflux transporter periplasmic adaptor subunit [Vicinamibacteria bacterium]|nr:HlyD family efflux transporter periplasmic adaptor subunit [Vicinamibacteria bacterium]
MDVVRSPEFRKARRRRRIILSSFGFLALLLVTLGLSRLKPAPPSVERASVWIDAVKRGEMLRQVRGVGTLVPQEIRWIPAATEGRVERIVVLPGSAVKPDTVILELSNPELELEALDAAALLRAAEADLAGLKVKLATQRIDLEASMARVEAERQQARLEASAKEELAKEGLVAAIDLKKAQVNAAELDRRRDLEGQRMTINTDSVAAQLAAQQAQVDRQRALARLRRSQLEALRVRAGIAGILQQVPVDVGQRVGPGANLARVAQPERLKAVVRVPETQARDIQIGQKATVDTRNEVITAHVIRIDPAVREGTVEVDLALDGPLPKGARPDLSVDGTIELERLTEVLYVGRPAMGQAEGTIGLFRLEPNGRDAARVQVKLGRASVSTIEIVQGLKEGEQVILSETSAWDSHDRIRLD